jgi:hypothetical protein
MDGTISFPPMAKVDFSALKTADLRSVAPIGEGMRPASFQAPEPTVAVSAPVAQTASVSTPVTSAATSAPIVPAGRKISLTSLRSGSSGSAAPVAQTVAPAAVETPAAVSAPVAPAAEEPAVPAVSLSRPAIRLSKTPAVTAVAEAPVEVEELSAAEEASVAVSAITEEPAAEAVVPVAGDLLETGTAAAVMGTEAEEMAKKLLESDSDTVSVVLKKDEPVPEEPAIEAALTAPGQEFFPNLEMDDDLFSDLGIEPEGKPAKVEEVVAVEVPVAEEETATSEATADEAEPVAEISATDIVETPAVEAVAGEEFSVVAKESPAVTEAKESVAAEAELSMEEPVLEISATDIVNIPSAEKASEVSKTPEYVETVAKDLSATRKGGMAALFGNRKVLVSSVAGTFATLAVVAMLAVKMLPIGKVSAPEVLPQPPVPVSQIGGPVSPVPVPPDQLGQSGQVSSYVNPVRKPNRLK